MKLDVYLHDNEVRKQQAESYQLTQKNIKRIKDIALKVVRYPEFKEAYEYVDSFPRCSCEGSSHI